MNYVDGVDISFWQSRYRDINWQVLKKRAGYIWSRWSDGEGIDERARPNRDGCMNNFAAWGLYHVAYPNQDARVTGKRHGQAEFQYGGTINCLMDWERNAGKFGKQLVDWLYVYYQEFSHYSGRAGIVYTNPNFLRYTIGYQNIPYWMYELDLCIAHYGVLSPMVPPGWNWTFWQHKIYRPATDYGCAPPPAAASGIDLDRYQGNEAQFFAKFGVLPNPIYTPAPPEELPKSVTVQVQGANIRNAPAPDAKFDVGGLVRGKALPVTGETGDYYEVKLYVHKSVVKAV